jgi:hypothetical protein
MIGKLCFVAIIYRDWIYGEASARLAALVTIDLVFAVLFALYLRRQHLSVIAPRNLA